MNTGIIKFFHAGKGFGFVTPDGGGADIFLPAAAVTAAGITAVKPGERIRFKQAPDTKGPKVIALELVEEAPAKAPGPAAERLTIYCDASSDLAAEIAEAVRDSGISVITHDYMVAPPGVDQLKRLSQMLGGSGQSLVRRYDPLFLALQLDDRFITDQDFWMAIVEHPALINGPVLTVSGRARVCKTASEAKAFLNRGGAVAPAKPKTLSPRIAAMLRGEPLPAAPPAAEKEVVVAPPAPDRLPKQKPQPVAKPLIKPVAKPKKIVVKLPPAKTAKNKTPAKKAAKPAKPIKKRAKK